MAVFIVFVVVSFMAFFAIVGSIGWALTKADRRHKRADRVRPVGAATTPNELLAASHGFRLDSASKKLPPQEFAAFEWIQGPRVVNQVWRDGEQDSAFQLMFSTTDDNGHRRLHEHRICALISVPFRAPHTRIGPERAVGADIDIESPTFNAAYRVTGDDERFAVTLLDHQMIGWLLSEASGPGETRFEFLDSWMLVEVGHFELDRMFGFLDWAQSVRNHLPAVLTSLYPAAPFGTG